MRVRAFPASDIRCDPLKEASRPKKRLITKSQRGIINFEQHVMLKIYGKTSPESFLISRRCCLRSLRSIDNRNYHWIIIESLFFMGHEIILNHLWMTFRVRFAVRRACAALSSAETRHHDSSRSARDRKSPDSPAERTSLPWEMSDCELPWQSTANTIEARSARQNVSQRPLMLSTEANLGSWFPEKRWVNDKLSFMPSANSRRNAPRCYLRELRISWIIVSLRYARLLRSGAFFSLTRIWRDLSCVYPSTNDSSFILARENPLPRRRESDLSLKLKSDTRERRTAGQYRCALLPRLSSFARRGPYRDFSPGKPGI